MRNYLKQFFCKHSRVTNERDYIYCNDCGKIIKRKKSSSVRGLRRFLCDYNLPDVCIL